MNDMQSALDALRPKLVGQDWSAYEGCSLLGVVIRMARLFDPAINIEWSPKCRRSVECSSKIGSWKIGGHMAPNPCGNH